MQQARLSETQVRMSGLEHEIATLKSGVSTPKSDSAAGTSEVTALKSETSRLKTEFDAFCAAEPAGVQVPSKPAPVSPAAKPTGVQGLATNMTVVQATGEVVLTSDRRRVTAAFCSGAGSCAESSGFLVDCITMVDAGKGGRTKDLIVVLDAAIKSGSTASALSGIRVGLRKACAISVVGTAEGLATAAASNDVATVGLLLGPRDVNTVCFNERELPESLVRHTFNCSLLDVAVGSGSVEMTKYLLEFHRATPTRETLKQSLSTGNLELIKLMRERLPEGELRYRVDLLEAAAEFHQEEVLAWLLRDATVFDRELLGVFALERKLADSFVVALEDGFHPWRMRTREVSLKWRASRQLEFVSAPGGFSSGGGWWTSLFDATSALRGGGSETGHGPTLPKGALGVGSVVEFEWTKEVSQAQFGDAILVKSVVSPPAVTAIGDNACCDFPALESVVFPAGCTDFGKWAFARCKALKAVSLPVGCKATCHYAFAQCTSLATALIPAGCVTVSASCFSGDISLTGVRLPDGLTLVGTCAFSRCALREIALPDGCQVSRSAFYRCELLTKVTIGRGSISIGYGAFQGCGTLTTVTIGDGLASIGGYAFHDCSVLAAVALPQSVLSIGAYSFAACSSLLTIAVPKGCHLLYCAFYECRPRVTRF
jgi:hypothetical protein